MTPPLDVAVGILIRDDGSFLLAERPAGKPMAGYWEFPGGKLEADESVFDALVREFREELGLSIVAAHPWVQRVVIYPHATVRLHYWRSFGETRGWRGNPRSLEGQAFRWEHVDRLTTEPWLEGAWPVRRWLRLPPVYAISNAAEMGVAAFVAALDRRLAADRVKLLQLREPELDADSFAALFEDVLARCRRADAMLVVSSRHPEVFWSRGDGVHLTSDDLMRSDVRPDVDWCLASCHDAAQLQRAADIGVDAAVIGPVKRTASHPSTKGIGWGGLAAHLANGRLPVYAIGGLDERDLVEAIACGAHGIAMMRGAWTR